MRHQLLDPSELSAQIRSVLEDWGSRDATACQFDWMYIFRREQVEQGDAHDAMNALLLQGLDRLTEQGGDPATHGRMLRMRYLDGRKIRQVANALNVDESTVYRYREKGCLALAKTLLDMEKEVRDGLRREVENRIEAPTYTQLIGIENHLSALADLLLSPDPPYVIVVTGLGGLGKTSLANEVVRYLMNKAGVMNIGWITTRHEILHLSGHIDRVPSALVTVEELVEALLRQLIPDHPPPAATTVEHSVAVLERFLSSPHVIVLDNVESLANLRQLAPLLNRLSNPSKFLITSRYNLYDEEALYHYPLPELSEHDALALVRQQAKSKNIVHVLQATHDELRPIYASVGGNPLAIKLVTGQVFATSLDRVLADLERRGPLGDGLFNFIYRQIWDYALDDVQKDVLLAMLMISGSGDNLELLQAATELDLDTLIPSLAYLVSLNVVSSVGTLNERRYSIHPLTATFLKYEVAQLRRDH